MPHCSVYRVAQKGIQCCLRTLLYPGDAIGYCGAAKQASVKPLERCNGLFLAPHPWSLARWMPLKKQCEPRFGASNARVLRSRESLGSRQLHFTYLIAPYPFLVPSVSSPGSWFQLRRKNCMRKEGTLLFDDYGISVGLIAPR